uniref:Histone acetyltransferase n=1 Tax=Ditylenchus dipsaci TaxID=166011 RepID=A0A915CVF2_9BILA
MGGQVKNFKRRRYADCHSSGPAKFGKTLTRSQRRFHEEFHHLQKSYEDMDATTAKLEREHEERTKVKNVDLIQFGEYEIDAWYFSPFPLPVTINNSKILFCEFCLWYTVDLDKYACHCVHKCSVNQPPGVEIYRDEIWQLSKLKDERRRPTASHYAFYQNSFWITKLCTTTWRDSISIFCAS